MGNPCLSRIHHRSTLTTLLLVAGFAGASVIRAVPRVVTGISFLSVIQGLLLLGIVRQLWRGRREIGVRVRRAPGGRHLAVLVGIGLVLLCLFLVRWISAEVEAGRRYGPIAKHLEREDAAAALDLAGDLVRSESGPLRARILERIGDLGNGEADVLTAVRGVLRTDAREDVRAAAAAALGRILPPSALVATVAELPALDDPTRALFADVLRRRTGAKLGGDPAAWRGWVATTLIPGEGPPGFRAAMDALALLGDDPAVREAALARLRSGDGADPAALLRLLDAKEPETRAAAAVALGRVGRPEDVWPLASRLKGEEDATAIRSLVDAVLALDPVRAKKALAEAARGARSEAARAAAAAALDGLR